MNITRLGTPRFPSPLTRHVSDSLRVPAEIVRDMDAPPPAAGMSFELAGPRAKLFFDPSQTRAGIVTCGGLCPGLNDVIRSLFLELHHAYRIREVLGFRGGYQGLDPACGLEPLVLTSEFVDDIHTEGGTVLGTSRGPVDTARAVDALIRRGINILFAVGGDGTTMGQPVEGRDGRLHEPVARLVVEIGDQAEPAALALVCGIVESGRVMPAVRERSGAGGQRGGCTGISLGHLPSSHPYRGHLVRDRTMKNGRSPVNAAPQQTCCNAAPSRAPGAQRAPGGARRS